MYQYLVYRTGTGIIIGTRRVRVLYEIGATYEVRHNSHSLVVANLGILVAADQASMHTLPNSTRTQSREAEPEHKHKHDRCRGQQL